MSTHLEHLAGRLAGEPFFLAAPLAAYQRSARADDNALAAKLGCPVERLVRLRLCRAPAPEAPQFWHDIEQIARAFNLDPDALAEVVRQGQSILLLSADTATSGHGFLMAARDAEQEPSKGEEE